MVCVIKNIDHVGLQNLKSTFQNNRKNEHFGKVIQNF